MYGVTDDVHVATVVKNTGENAYLANMKINISSDLSIIGVDINGVNNYIALINIDKLVVLMFNFALKRFFGLRLEITVVCYITTQLTFTFSKSTIKTLKKDMKYVQS